MITSDGWLDWAIRLPGPRDHTNAGTNSVRGIFMHSAEGYKGALLDPASPWGYNGDHSWHLTNLMDGRVFQHYPLTARCWHATAANQEYVGVENEGDYPKEPTLTEAQIVNAVRFIRDIAAWKGWEPSRPLSATDKLHTLWEHREVTRIGGTASECPSGRIPWAELMRRLQGDDTLVFRPGLDGMHRVGKYLVTYNAGLPVLRLGGSLPGQIAKRFGDAWRWQRTRPDGTIFYSDQEGD